jgi:hypothetical protein
MRRFSLLAASLFAFSMVSAPALAEADCELPSGIEEDERYLIKFKWDTKPRRFKIMDVSDCWIMTERTDGNHRWTLIKDIQFIGSKEIED